jgi:hypothetical protein
VFGHGKLTTQRFAIKPKHMKMEEEEEEEEA